MKSILLIAAVLAALLLAPAPPAQGRQLDWTFNAQAAEPGKLVVGLQKGIAAASLSQSLPRGVALDAPDAELAVLNVSLINVPVGQEENTAREILKMPGVLFVEPTHRVKADLTPDDPFWNAPSIYSPNPQYGPKVINAPAAWDTTTGSPDVTIAIIDSGVDTRHPEFAGRLLPGYDFLQNDTSMTDDCGHGTHVTGIAAASGNNAIGIAGMDWRAKILPLRVLHRGLFGCDGTDVDVARALVFAVDHYGAQVINISLGACGASRIMEIASYYAYKRGAAIFAAAGNTDSCFSVLTPAAYPWVVAVAATNASNRWATFSIAGPQVDIAAPGDSILATTPISGSFLFEQSALTHNYGVLSGTSMAAPHAAGAAALLAGQAGFDHPDAIYAALENTAVPVSGATANQVGHGLIQVDAALHYIPSGVPPQPPAPLVDYTMYSSTRCQNIQFAWRVIPDVPANQLFIPGANGSDTITLPFPFVFGGRTFTTATISVNGYVAFDNVIPPSTPRDDTNGVNLVIPSGYANPNSPASAPERSRWFAAPFWDDLNPSAGNFAGIFNATIDNTPSGREYVLEWRGVPIQLHNTTTEVTFQLVLGENSHTLLYQYQNLSGPQSDGSSATIGLEYNDGASGVQYAYNQRGAVRANQAILFVPRAPGQSLNDPGCLLADQVDSAGGAFELLPFCLNVPSGLLTSSTLLHMNLMSSFPPTPAAFNSLNHFVEITLGPLPQPPLKPPPVVCYHYTPADLLHAGGRAQNLYFAVYDSETNIWARLPTAVDAAQHIITAAVPHFSIFGVFTNGGSAASAAGSLPENLPVTGAPAQVDWRSLAALLLALLAAAGVILWRG